MAVTFHHRRLDNGMDIIAETDPNAATSAAGFFVRTGARDEDPAVMGVSHYLEHMMFKGTAKLSAEDINRGFDAMGARNNAYTTNEMTCFYAHVLPERNEENLDLLSAMMRPALRQADFDTEKGVILEEIAMYRDNPFWILYESSVDRYYTGHPLAHRVLGTEDTIKALTSEQMRAYFDAKYSAASTVVSLAGKIDFDEACDRIEKSCGDWPSMPAERFRGTHTPKRQDFEIRDEKVNRAYTITISKAPTAADEDRYPAALAMQMLGMPDNSTLHWSLIETGIAEEAQAAYDPHDGFGDFFVYASGDPERLDQILEKIDAELDALAGKITEDDLDRLRARMATAATLGGERPADRMQRIGRDWTNRGSYSPLEHELKKISSVTLDQVRDVLAKYSTQDRTRGVLLPANAEP